MTDWLAWHEKYERPGSMSQRLVLVQNRLRRALDACPPGPVTLVSACAGQGRDVLGVVPRHPRRDDVRALLVEFDPANVEIARSAAAAENLTAFEVRRADAGAAASYDGWVPADVVLVCGVFGNISDADIRTTIGALPRFCAPGAHVIWTRHREPPDVTPSIRGWFAEAGFDEVALDFPADLSIGVGVHRLAGAPAPFRPEQHLFTFVT